MRGRFSRTALVEENAAVVGWIKILSVVAVRYVSVLKNTPSMLFTYRCRRFPLLDHRAERRSEPLLIIHSPASRLCEQERLEDGQWHWAQMQDKGVPFSIKEWTK